MVNLRIKSDLLAYEVVRTAINDQVGWMGYVKMVILV